MSGGKISVDKIVITDLAYELREGQTVIFIQDAPKPRGAHDLKPEAVLYMDRHILVAVKPAGILTVPFERGDKGTFDQQLRSFLARREKRNARKKGALPSLMTVHRLDKATSGVLVFARTWAAKEGLAKQFRDHSTAREYVALVYGRATSKKIVSHILEDRGDGIRGSSETSPHPKVRRAAKGQRAVTHVKVQTEYKGVTLVTCKLETGRTNQIRIHMSEDGHPLIGERIYMRGFKDERIYSERLMLHAAHLGFNHPVTQEKMTFKAPLPSAFQTIICDVT